MHSISQLEISSVLELYGFSQYPQKTVNKSHRPMNPIENETMFTSKKSVFYVHCDTTKILGSLDNVYKRALSISKSCHVTLFLFSHHVAKVSVDIHYNRIIIPLAQQQVHYVLNYMDVRIKFINL